MDLILQNREKMWIRFSLRELKSGLSIFKDILDIVTNSNEHMDDNKYTVEVNQDAIKMTINATGVTYQFTNSGNLITQLNTICSKMDMLNDYEWTVKSLERFFGEVYSGLDDIGLKDLLASIRGHSGRFLDEIKLFQGAVNDNIKTLLGIDYQELSLENIKECFNTIYIDYLKKMSRESAHPDYILNALFSKSIYQLVAICSKYDVDQIEQLNVGFLFQKPTMSIYSEFDTNTTTQALKQLDLIFRYQIYNNLSITEIIRNELPTIYPPDAIDEYSENLISYEFQKFNDLLDRLIFDYRIIEKLSIRRIDFLIMKIDTIECDESNENEQLFLDKLLRIKMVMLSEKNNRILKKLTR